jgi:hypothetical protein
MRWSGTPALPCHVLDRGAVAALALGREATLFEYGQGIAHDPRVELRAVGRGAGRADVVDAGQQTPHHIDLLVAELVGRAPAGARPDGAVDVLDRVQRFAVRKRQRRVHGDLCRAQVREKAVLFEDRRAAPTPRPVELHDHVALGFEADVEDPVLETHEGRHVTGGRVAACLHGSQHRFRRQGEEELGHDGRQSVPELDRRRPDCRALPVSLAFSSTCE